MPSVPSSRRHFVGEETVILEEAEERQVRHNGYREKSLFSFGCLTSRSIQMPEA